MASWCFPPDLFRRKAPMPLDRSSGACFTLLRRVTPVPADRTTIRRRISTITFATGSTSRVDSNLLSRADTVNNPHQIQPGPVGKGIVHFGVQPISHTIDVSRHDGAFWTKGDRALWRHLAGDQHSGVGSTHRPGKSSSLKNASRATKISRSSPA